MLGIMTTSIFVEAESLRNFSRVIELLADRRRIPTWFQMTPSLTPYTTPWHHFGNNSVDTENYC